MSSNSIRSTSRKRLIVAIAGPLLVSLILSTSITSARYQIPQTPTGVLRLRARVKIGEATKGLSRKRFYLLKGSLEQNKVVIEAAGQSAIVSRDCFYTKLGASPALIQWLKAGDCESVYCREIQPEFISGPTAVPEFATAYRAGEKEFVNDATRQKWVTNNLPGQLRDGFYQERRKALQGLIKQSELVTGPVLSVMTDRNGTAYFTDLEPGAYVLTNLLPTEIGESATTWNCEVQIKPGDIATEKPFLVSNRNDRNVKCVGVEKPLPACAK
jgi:hypothetical protein